MPPPKKLGRRYIEDFPWLEAKPLLNALGNGACEVEWENGDLDPVLTVTGFFKGDGAVCLQNAEDAYNETIIALVEVSAGGAGARKVFACPGCAQRAATLFFCERAWKCRDCHGLAYSTKYDTATQKKIREFGTLALTTGPSRRPYQRVEKHAAALERMEELQAELAVAKRLEEPRRRNLEVLYRPLDDLA